MSNSNNLCKLALDGDLLAIQTIVHRLKKWEDVFGHLGEPDEVGNEWHALSDRLEAAENENAKLRIALVEKVTSETILRDLSVRNGSINATFEGGAIQLMVEALATQFVESGAANYIEMQFHSEATGPLLFTLQRVDGKTPHQLRAEAEQERDALRAEVESWRGLAKQFGNEADALRAQPAPSTPEGWRLAPIKPTPVMKTAGIGVEVYQDSPPSTDCLTWEEVEAIYTAMIEVAPEVKSCI